MLCAHASAYSIEGIAVIDTKDESHLRQLKGIYTEESPLPGALTAVEFIV